MLKIRLMRIGAKKRPFYRVVVVDERSKRNGAYLELLGTYNPLTEPKEVKLKQDKIDEWVKKGAQFSDGFLRVIGKAPQRPPRKPKKDKISKEEKVPEVSKSEDIEDVNPAGDGERGAPLSARSDSEDIEGGSEPAGPAGTGSEQPEEKEQEEAKDEGPA